MSKHKYLVVPGVVFAQDGDRHYIKADQLMHLYGVRRADCLVTHGNDKGSKVRGYTPEYLRGLIRLEPRSDGNYSLEQPHD